MRLQHTVFPLHPETPEEGLTLDALFGPHVDVGAMRRRMEELMAAEGLPYGDRTHTYNSRLAQELAKWADRQPGGEAIHQALYQAYFVTGINLANIDDLPPIAESIGLSGSEAREVLDQRSEREAVDADWARARARGVTGVPTFVANSVVVVGAQPYEVLEQLVVQAGAQRST